MLFTDVLVENMKKNGSLRPSKPKFRYIFCDMDGELSYFSRNL